ncbi:MAG: FAD-dependent oxidoreductase [Burkholderiaceae bacterium]|nr:FAD-dependent oxidoreductase [Burkholderiaceae bacterium]
MSAALQADQIVVGGGPAGIAAVRTLLAAKQRVIWIDNQAWPGGQIWRGGPARHGSALGRSWAQSLNSLLADPLLTHLPGHAVIAAEGPQQLLLHDSQGGASLRVSGAQLLLALGARERFLPFPGWTLPGVTGAGGLQALVKGGWPIKGQRVVLAGSGPLLLASADTLRSAGADVACVAEQASFKALSAFAAGLPSAKLVQALGLRWRLKGVAYRTGCWPVRALGDTQVRAVVLTDGQREWELPCDALGLGFGLLPNTELAELLGCRIDGGAVAVDERLQTSLPQVFAAGECTGIGGVDKALLEGDLAANAMLSHDLAPFAKPHARALAFGALLARHFALRPELLKLADAKTLICRCEDVTLGDLKAWPDWREAKLQTRCGMGACQGRICGPIARDLLGWPMAAGRGLREPLQPAPLSCFLSEG